jgi:hypothetical protein
VDPNEQCDPPGSECADDLICNDDCECIEQSGPRCCQLGGTPVPTCADLLPSDPPCEPIGVTVEPGVCSSTGVCVEPIP